MAILQEVDKCLRCNGCVISCKRTWHMKGLIPSDDLPNRKLTFNQRVVIKSQGRVDSGPFVRFSCWHCENPPCGQRCPYSAIQKNETTGAVWIDPNKCKPGEKNLKNVECVHQCKIDCQKGGVPMIGAGCEDFGVKEKAQKCTLCTGYPGSPYAGAGTTLSGADLPTKAPGLPGERVSQLTVHPPLVLPDASTIEALDHQPSCVFTCPAKAMVYDTRANILAYVDDPANGFISKFGGGAMFWASKTRIVAAPKADPFMEDHVAPMIGSLLSSPFAKAALAPTLVVGGLLALSARRAKIEEELSLTGGEL